MNNEREKRLSILKRAIVANARMLPYYERNGDGWEQTIDRLLLRVQEFRALDDAIRAHRRADKKGGK